MAMRIGQNNRPLPPLGGVLIGAAGRASETADSVAGLSFCIFLALLAIDAIPRVRQRVEALVRDVLAAVVALAERVGRLVQPAQRLVDVPEEAAFLAGEEE